MTSPHPKTPYSNVSNNNSYQGGCHCGAVRFAVKMQAQSQESPKVIICNCSICTKKGFVHCIVPKENFTLLIGKNHLAEYRFNTHAAQHLFCEICGIHSFYRPRSHPDCWDVNLNCLDSASDPEFMNQFEIQAFDGQNWEDNVQSITQGNNVDTTDCASDSQ